MKATRRKTVERRAGVAECSRCSFRLEAANALGNAARHHDATGHPVTVDLETRVTFGDPAAPPEGQTALDVETAPTLTA